MQGPKKIIIYYFSGTGNAKQIALWAAEFAYEKDIDCQVLNIADIDSYSLDSIDSETLLAIISPIHGFNFPKITLDFIRCFPKGNNQFLLMNTRAGMKIGRYATPGLTGIAFHLSSFILKSKGYKIMGHIPFDMPSNWISIHPALNDNTVKFLHKENYARAEKHLEPIFNGEKNFYANRDFIQDLLISPVSLAYYLVGRFAFAKSYYASFECDHCGLCEKNCPVHGIKNIQDRPYWTYKCESCMKCMNLCPKKAIETPHVLFILISIISSMITSFLLSQMMDFDINSGFINTIISTIIFFLFLGLFYRTQHFLLRFMFVAKIISYLSFTSYKFWGRYHSIPDRDWK